ncbi:DUF5320 domain-containing protein [bacterium BMS3Abin03]|nr:DUF5320 domain-containing protein [bacterium BMS3Abin03]
MPNFDGTGPMGKGHLTGRERGGCRKSQSVHTEKSGTQLADGRNIFNGLYRRGRLHREESGRGRGGRCDGIKKGFNK